MNILETCTSPKTVREISETLGKSETWTRDSLKALILSGQIVRDGTVKPATFTTKVQEPEVEVQEPEVQEPEAEVQEPEVKAQDDLDAELGLNEPEAKAKKVSINPQSAINKMIKEAAEAGQEMTYDRSSKTWTIGSRKVLSKNLPELRASGFPEWLASSEEAF